MKSTVTPAEILETIQGLPALSPVYPEMEVQERLKALLAGRPENAFVTRVLIYSVDGAAEAEALLGGGMPVHETCRMLDGEMQLIEMDTDTTAPGDNARATAFGLMAAEANTGLIVTTAIGPQNPVDDFWNDTSPNVAAILGTMISGAIANIPVIAEGPGATIAADMLNKLRPDMMPYVFVCEAPDDATDGAGYAGCMLAAWALSQAIAENAA